MLHTDVRNNAKDRCDKVRSIESTAKARLNNRHLDVTLVEVVEGHRRCHLEKR